MLGLELLAVASFFVVVEVALLAVGTGDTDGDEQRDETDEAVYEGDDELDTVLDSEAEDRDDKEFGCC